MKSAIIAILFVTTLSCNDAIHIRERHRLFNENSYDSQVIGNLVLYDSLKNVVLSHIDTIIQYRNSRSGTLPQDKQYSHRFTFHPELPVSPRADTGFDRKTATDMNDLRNMPNYVYKEAVRICHKLGGHNIDGFWLNSDSSLTITVREDMYEIADAVVVHELLWNQRYVYADEAEMLVHDTLIAPGWNYRVIVSEANHF